MRHGNVAGLGCRHGTSSHQPGKEEGLRVERCQPVMECVRPAAGDAREAAYEGYLLVVPAQRMVHIGQHLFAVGGRPDRVLQASLRTKARGPLEAGRNGAPEATTGPLEGVTLAVHPHFLGAIAKLLSDGALALGVAGRSAQIEERRVDVATQVARVVMERLKVLLEIQTELSIPGGQQ